MFKYTFPVNCWYFFVMVVMTVSSSLLGYLKVNFKTDELELNILIF